ncbi:MAG: hypothetical protein V7L29_24925 [Nostoc sp.]|uniref:hypothetical protein n=1 Tax=Nostoc sp. TaxID=1180 RepID=UPI002FFD4174
MFSPDLKNALPTTDELPCSDNTPVDNVDRRARLRQALFHHSLKKQSLQGLRDFTFQILATFWNLY